MTGVRRMLLLCQFAAVPVCAAQSPAPVPADFSWTLQTVRGERVPLETFRGRVLVINSWATWCEPCVAELRTFQLLRGAIPDSALQILLVAAQRPDPVMAFMRRRRVQLPVFLESAPAPSVYRFEAVPTTWIIDRQGRIVFRHRGAMRWDTPAVQAYVRALLQDTALSAAPAPPPTRARSTM